jgi:hypothetical protein
MADESVPEFIESTAGEVASELARREVRPEQPVIVTVEPDDWVTRARAYSRPLVREAGWTEADIDRIIDEEREAVQSQLG